MRIGIALVFDLLRLILALLAFFLPLIAGVAAGSIAESACKGAIPSWVPGSGYVCAGTGAVIGTAITVGGYVLEFGTGVGAAGTEMLGEILADALNILAWVIFTLWFASIGASFFGGKRAANRFLTVMASSTIGLVPFVNFAPTITIGVAGVEYNHWKEQVEKAARRQQQDSSRQARIQAQQDAYQQVLEERLNAQIMQEEEIAALEMQAANDDFEAANDNEESDAKERAAA